MIVQVDYGIEVKEAKNVFDVKEMKIYLSLLYATKVS